MGLFSKEECVFCGEKAGMLGRKKMQDGDYICKDCEENCSIYFDPGRFTKEEVESHFEYMKKQDVLYKNEYETLSKDEVSRHVYKFEGIIFADNIAMFELVDPKTKKRKYKELFRYDQVADFERYGEENREDEGKKFSETGVEIIMRCSEGVDGVGMTEAEKGKAHPYLHSIKIKCGDDADNLWNDTGRLMDKLNEIYLRESDNKSIGQGIKEMFTGSEKEQRDIKQGADMLKAFGKFAKAAIDKDDESMEAAKDNLKETTVSTLNNSCGNQAVHGELADAAQKRAWGE